MEKYYRDLMTQDDLVNFNVTCDMTDLFISAERELFKETGDLVIHYRQQIQDYISKYPEFKSSLEPLPLNLHTSAPSIITDMIKVSKKAGVGPMAAVAGAIAEYVGKSLLEYSSNVIVENGGDIFLKTTKDRIVGIYAGDSIYTGKIGVKIKATQTPCGICTSSGTVGHSLSFGKADAVIIFSGSAILADAIATATCNKVKEKDDIKNVLEFVKGFKDIFGVAIIYGEEFGMWGEIEIVNFN